MASITQYVVSEVADNWPAFVYIALTLGFSVCFLRERRAEIRILKEMGQGLQEGIRTRFDRLEYMVGQSRNLSALPASQPHSPDEQKAQDRHPHAMPEFAPTPPEKSPLDPEKVSDAPSMHLKAAAGA
jgi:hypothetical protein